jgi:hypothetical protein
MWYTEVQYILLLWKLSFVPHIGLNFINLVTRKWLCYYLNIPFRVIFQFFNNFNHYFIFHYSLIGSNSLHFIYSNVLTMKRRYSFPYTVYIVTSNWDGQKQPKYFFIINQLDAPISLICFGWKLYMFRTFPLSIIRSFSLYIQQWYMSYRLLTACKQDQNGTGFHPDPACRLSATCMTYTIAVCTVKNSWWWKEELSEKCRVSFQNKFEKLVHLVGFIDRYLPFTYNLL